MKTLKQIKSIRHILPVLMILLTRKNRYLPEIEWSSKSWTHNIFRLYEMLFWRKEGIRREVSSYGFVEDGVAYQYQFAHSLEASLAIPEELFREWVKNLFRPIRAKIWIPQFAPVGGFSPQMPYLFAIARNTSTASANNTAFPITVAHTITGSNTYLAAGIDNESADGVTGVTMNGVSMTQQIKQLVDGGIYIYIGMPYTHQQRGIS